MLPSGFYRFVPTFTVASGLAGSRGRQSFSLWWPLPSGVLICTGHPRLARTGKRSETRPPLVRAAANGPAAADGEGAFVLDYVRSHQAAVASHPNRGLTSGGDPLRQPRVRILRSPTRPGTGPLCHAIESRRQSRSFCAPRRTIGESAHEAGSAAWRNRGGTETGGKAAMSRVSRRPCRMSLDEVERRSRRSSRHQLKIDLIQIMEDNERLRGRIAPLR